MSPPNKKKLEVNDEHHVEPCDLCQASGYDPNRGYDSAGNRYICGDCDGVGFVLKANASTRKRKT